MHSHKPHSILLNADSKPNSNAFAALFNLPGITKDEQWFITRIGKTIVVKSKHAESKITIKNQLHAKHLHVSQNKSGCEYSDVETSC